MKRQNYKSLERTAYRNLSTLYRLATPEEIAKGREWYWNAHYDALRIANHYSLSVQQVCGVIAALSPGLKWELNLPNAESLIQIFKSSQKIEESFGLSVYGRDPIRKAWRILAGEAPLDVLRGLKVTSFYSNLCFPHSSGAVTVDGHIKLACLGTRYGNHDTGPVSTTVSKFEYPHWVAVIRRLSSELVLQPSQLQAILWLTWRRLPIGFKLASRRRSGNRESNESKLATHLES